jgi:hypothetical protein
MSKLHGFLWMVLVFLLVVPAGQGSADSGIDQQAIERILDLFEKVYLDEDMDLLASLLSDQGYVMVMKQGADPSAALVLDKKQVVQMMVQRFERVDYLEHRHIDRSIRIDGPAATSTSTIVDRLDTSHTQRSRVYHIYVREEAGWKIVFTSNLLTD